MGNKRIIPRKIRSIRDDSLFQRRQNLMRWLSLVREASYKDIHAQFGITDKSIKRDLDSLEIDFGVPLIRKSGNHGSVKVRNGWYASKPHFLSWEVNVLIEIMLIIPKEYNAYKDFIVKLIIKYGNEAALDGIDIS